MSFNKKNKDIIGKKEENEIELKKELIKKIINNRISENKKIIELYKKDFEQKLDMIITYNESQLEKNEGVEKKIQKLIKIKGKLEEIKQRKNKYNKEEDKEEEHYKEKEKLIKIVKTIAILIIIIILILILIFIYK